MRGMVHDTNHQDPLWPYQDREELVEMFIDEAKE